MIDSPFPLRKKKRDDGMINKFPIFKVREKSYSGL
jgi:hypothetical protein